MSGLSEAGLVCMIILAFQMSVCRSKLQREMLFSCRSIDVTTTNLDYMSAQEGIVQLYLKVWHLQALGELIPRLAGQTATIYNILSLQSRAKVTLSRTLFA